MRLLEFAIPIGLVLIGTVLLVAGHMMGNIIEFDVKGTDNEAMSPLFNDLGFLLIVAGFSAYILIEFLKVIGLLH